MAKCAGENRSIYFISETRRFKRCIATDTTTISVTPESDGFSDIRNHRINSDLQSADIEDCSTSGLT